MLIIRPYVTNNKREHTMQAIQKACINIIRFLNEKSNKSLNSNAKYSGYKFQINNNKT